MLFLICLYTVAQKWGYIFEKHKSICMIFKK